MKSINRFIALGGLIFITQSSFGAENIVVYPNKGQSSKQQEKDKGECHQWAIKKTGIDPMALAETPAPSSKGDQQGGTAVRGAAKGAVGGAIVGGIAGDAGKGAAIGAGAGGLGGASHGRRAKQHAAKEQEQFESAKQQSIAALTKAEAACLEGRGYSVK